MARALNWDLGYLDYNTSSLRFSVFPAVLRGVDVCVHWQGVWWTIDKEYHN